MCDHKGISALTFVGSSKVAEIVYKRCTSLNKRVLALGGAKNHLIALPDCDVGMTSRDVVASYAGCAGQRCMASSVLLIVGESNGLLDEIVSVAGKLQPQSVYRYTKAMQSTYGPLLDLAITKVRAVVAPRAATRQLWEIVA